LSAIEGKFLDKKKAKGFLKDEREEHEPDGFSSVCASGKVRWTAHR
jgi:hypothetical protein